MPACQTGHRRQDTAGQGLWGSPGSSLRNRREATFTRTWCRSAKEAAARGSDPSCTRSSDAHTGCEVTHSLHRKTGFPWGSTGAGLHPHWGRGRLPAAGGGCRVREPVRGQWGVPWEMPCHTPLPWGCGMPPAAHTLCTRPVPQGRGWGWWLLVSLPQLPLGADTTPVSMRPQEGGALACLASPPGLRAPAPAPCCPCCLQVRSLSRAKGSRPPHGADSWSPEPRCGRASCCRPHTLAGRTWRSPTASQAPGQAPGGPSADTACPPSCTPTCSPEGRQGS